MRIEETTGTDRDLHVCCSGGNSDKGPVVKDAVHPLPSIPDMKLDCSLVSDQTILIDLSTLKADG